jgi:hypothetical protein
MQGTEYVEVSADEDDAQSIDVDYDLEGKVFGENPAVDVKLTLRADFVGQQLQIDSTSFDVQVDMAEWLAFIIDGIGAGICGVVSGESCENMIEEYFEEMAERNFEPISEVFDVDTTLCTSPPTVEVTSNGDLVLDCDFELP